MYFLYFNNNVLNLHTLDRRLLLLTIVNFRSKYAAQLTAYCPIVTRTNNIMQASAMPTLRTYR